MKNDDMGSRVKGFWRILTADVTGVRSTTFNWLDTFYCLCPWVESFCYVFLADSCDASAAPTNGASGDCTATLASGSTCTPVCDAGYTLSAVSSCTTGTLTAGTCVGNTFSDSTLWVTSVLELTVYICLILKVSDST